MAAGCITISNPIRSVSVDLVSRLRPHQVEPVKRLLRILSESGSAAVDLSDTGTGKTYVAAAVAASLRLPTLVVGPKISETSWKAAAAYFGDGLSFVGYEMLRTGRSLFGTWSGGVPGSKLERYFKCTTCQCKFAAVPTTPCPYHARGIHCLETKTKPHRYGKFSFHPAVKLVVFDEIHRCNGIDSLNAELPIAAKRQGLKVIGLTATAGFSPLNLRALGYLLGWHNDAHSDLQSGRPAFYSWLRRAGCIKIPGASWTWGVSKDRQNEWMREARESIIPNQGIRVTSDTIPGFPECLITADLFNLNVEDTSDVNNLYVEMRSALEQLQHRQESDVAPDHPLTMLLRARQKIELLKVPVVAELSQDDEDKGFSSVIFVNFRQTIDELLKRFPDAGVIDGQTPDRPGVIARFQDNSNRRLIVNSRAGDVCMSLHDLHGDFPRAGLVMPGDSATSMRQLFGRLPRDGGRSRCRYRVVLAAGTLEVSTHRKITDKLNNLDALNDGDMRPDF